MLLLLLFVIVIIIIVVLVVPFVVHAGQMSISPSIPSEENARKVGQVRNEIPTKLICFGLGKPRDAMGGHGRPREICK